MPNDQVAPLWLLFAVQAVSVVGDTFGQRCARVVHRHSRRSFMVSMTIVTCLQMFIVLSIIQLAAPSLVTRLMRKVSTNYNVTNTTANTNTTHHHPETIDVCALPHNDTNYLEHASACYPQGPLTLWKVFAYCPFVWLNGAMNILYYVCELSLYREPAGVVLLVIAALASSFLVNPLQHWVKAGDGEPLKPASIFIGIAGAILCVIERDPTISSSSSTSSTAIVASAVEQEEDPAAPARRRSPEQSLVDNIHDGSNNNNENDEQQQHQQRQRQRFESMETSPLQPSRENNSSYSGAGRAGGAAAAAAASFEHQNELQDKLHEHQEEASSCLNSSACLMLKSSLRVMPAFALLSVAYSSWWVLIRLFNEHCSLNAWGYNAADQVTLPLFLFPTVAIWDCMRARGWLSEPVGREDAEMPNSPAILGDPEQQQQESDEDEDEEAEKRQGQNQPNQQNNQHQQQSQQNATVRSEELVEHGGAGAGSQAQVENVNSSALRSGDHDNADEEDDNSHHMNHEDEVGSNFAELEHLTASSFIITVRTSLSRSAANYGSGFLQVFIYRLFINARAIAYAYIANEYDLAKSYLELTLIRILLSWVSSLCCILVLPRFIAATKKEALVFKDWLNLMLKIAGSALVVVSLIMLNK